MYIVRTDSTPLPKKIERQQRGAKPGEGPTFEETVSSLLEDAVELTNPNDEKEKRQSQNQNPEEQPPQGKPSDGKRLSITA